MNFQKWCAIKQIPLVIVNTGHLRHLLLALDLEQLGAQDLERADAVPKLGALLRAEDADTGGLVKKVHRRLHLVDVLAARPAAAGRLDDDVHCGADGGGPIHPDLAQSQKGGGG